MLHFFTAMKQFSSKATCIRIYPPSLDARCALSDARHAGLENASEKLTLSCVKPITVLPYRLFVRSRSTDNLPPEMTFPASRLIQQ